MSETIVASDVPATGGALNNDVDLKGKAVSAKLEAFARLLDPFAEGSKFTAINGLGAAEEDSNATESDNGAVAEETSDGETKDGAVAKEPDSKVVTEDSKTDTTETTIKEHSAAAKVDEEVPVVKKKRAPTKPKEVANDNEDIDGAADAKVDEEAPVVKKKRVPAKPKKAITDNENIDDAADAKVDGEAPVAKKRAPAKSKKATTDNEDIDDAADAKVDEAAPVAKKKRAPAKSKKATTDNEDIDDAADAKVDEAAPVAKKKRAPAKSKKATTDNEDIDDAADAKVDKEAPVAKKKRAPAPAKPKKPTTDNEDDGDATETNLPITPPVTPPKKRGRKASTADDADVNGSTPKPKASKKAKITESPEDSAEVTTSQESPSTTKTGTLRKRAAATKEKVVARGLPTSMKECSEADRMLLHMKDVEGKPWAEIRATWKTMTGQETAASTLPNRYNRLKVNLMALEEGDAPRLLSANASIDTEYAEYIAKFASEKWAKVQKAMEAQGTTNKYPSGFLQKEFQKLEAAGAIEDNKDGDVEMAEGEGSAAEGSKEEEGVKAED